MITCRMDGFFYALSTILRSLIRFGFMCGKNFYLVGLPVHKCSKNLYLWEFIEALIHSILQLVLRTLMEKGVLT